MLALLLPSASHPDHAAVLQGDSKVQGWPVQGPLKKWETYPLTANGKPLRNPMPMKTGDTVKIISGHDKGKVGKVTKV